MSKFFKFGALMVFIFVFLLPTVFPVNSPTKHPDVNPSIDTVGDIVFRDGVLSDEEKRRMNESEQKTKELYGLTEVFNLDTWVNVQDIETTVSEQSSHTAFNPVIKEDLCERAANSKTDKWVSINRANKDEHNKECLDTVTSDENHQVCDRHKPEANILENNNFICDFDQEDVKNLPAFPIGKNQQPTFNI